MPLVYGKVAVITPRPELTLVWVSELLLLWVFHLTNPTLVVALWEDGWYDDWFSNLLVHVCVGFQYIVVSEQAVKKQHLTSFLDLPGKLYVRDLSVNVSVKIVDYLFVVNIQ